jgi:Methylase involved in ubiquinone/menaquinone biosynthesis
MNSIRHEFERYWEENDMRVIDCKSCGFIHVDPIPTKQELLDFYSSRYFTEIKPFEYESVTKSFIEKKMELIEQNVIYKRIYSRVNSLLDKKKEHSYHMLDIGCGNDLLAKFFQIRNWNSVVLEPSEQAASYLRKFDLTVFERFADEVDELDLSDISFVNIQFVLEHISDPITLLKKVYRMMAPGGVIRVCVPNDFSDGQLAYKEHFDEKLHWVVRPDHINYFSFGSLSTLLAKCGFEEVYRSTNFPLEFLLLGGINYYSDESQKEKVNSFVKNFHKSFVHTGRSEKLTELYEALANLEMGRAVFMFAVKQ